MPSSCHYPAANLYTQISEKAKESGKMLAEELNQKALKWVNIYFTAAILIVSLSGAIKK